jgi:predicted nucleic acid-binding protein
VRYGLDLDTMREAIDIMPVQRYAESDYISHIAEARHHLRDRDPDDVALAALALKLGVPIWSNDNDFKNVPVDVYPTAKLLKILGL